MFRLFPPTGVEAYLVEIFWQNLFLRTEVLEYSVSKVLSILFLLVSIQDSSQVCVVMVNGFGTVLEMVGEACWF